MHFTYGTRFDISCTARTAPLRFWDFGIVFEGLVAACAEKADFDVFLGGGVYFGVVRYTDVAEFCGFEKQFHAEETVVVLF